MNLLNRINTFPNLRYEAIPEEQRLTVPRAREELAQQMVPAESLDELLEEAVANVMNAVAQMGDPSRCHYARLWNQLWWWGKGQQRGTVFIDRPLFYLCGERRFGLEDRCAAHVRWSRVRLENLDEQGSALHGLPIRTRHDLADMNIRSMEQLAAVVHADQLYECRRMGKKSQQAIREFVRRYEEHEATE